MQHSALIDFTLKGLTQCYMPEYGLWSYKHHLDGRSQPNESRPAYDVFYSLNVLLGLSKLSGASRKMLGIDTEAMFYKAAARLDEVAAPRYAYGTAIWTSAALELPAPEMVARRIRAMTADTTAIQCWSAQDIGMLLCGAVAQARTDPTWSLLARRARHHILANLRSESGLFRDSAVGVRRHFATFASQVYCTFGLYLYAEAFGDTPASEVADACVRKLIELQGPFGEWPWFFHVESGRVADFYEVYSVHQHGMAPAILKLAMGRHVEGSKEAVAKGFAWIVGQNELGKTMLRSDLSLIARSQSRRGRSGGRLARASRASWNVLVGRQAQICRRPAEIVITPEVRSYELGWTLWSFGDDTDFNDLTNHSAFGGADSVSSRRSPELEIPA